MPGKDIIVIGASAGGIGAIRTILSGLPRDFEGSVFVVVHTSPNAPGVLDVVFGTAGDLPAMIANNGERIEPGRVYVARPDHHLIIEPGRVRLTRGPKENRFRPAIDPLFRSAAQTYGPRVVGIVLSGGLDDGTSGLWAVKQLGGTAIVQDPKEAVVPAMPENALRHVRVDHVLPVQEIAPLLVRLSMTPADALEGDRPMPEEIDIEVKIASEEKAKEVGVLKLGSPSKWACPECHGVLLQMKDAIPPRFRCHTGHAYTLESLLADMDHAIEDSLWNAIRALEERVMLMRHAAEHDVNGDLLVRAEETQRRADLVRQAVMTEDEASSVSRVL
ncbi:MAG TPA: chemotaxis protein CheB [Thermoanaerobaculia bacterium]|nr:chemotaxis protein CheB [Thermoanaerobaculia bacterium]